MSDGTGTDPRNEASEDGDPERERSPQITGIDLKVAENDSYGNRVRRIFQYEPNRYVIYETDDLKVQVAGDTSMLSGAKRANELMSKIADYTAEVPLLKLKYNSARAHALRLLLDGDVAGCEKALESILESIPLFLARRSQLSYVLGSVGLTLLLLLLFGITFSLRLLNPLGVQIYTALVFAAMGGVMSVVIGMRKLDLNLNDNELVNGFYGALRIVIALIAGVFTLFLIESGFALAFLKNTQASPYGFTIAAFLSGFSEMFVPNILKKLDDQSSDKRSNG